MPESTIQPTSGPEQVAPALSVAQEDDPSQETEQVTHTEESEKPLRVTSTTPIIWTPRFLLVFALVLILGVSTDSLLASGWSTGFITGDGYLFVLGHILLSLIGWAILGTVTRSRWMRLGCIFGAICLAFLTLNVFAYIFGLDPNAPAQAYINIASCTALLGAYIGLTLEDTMVSTWDLCFFWLVAIMGTLGVVLAYMLTPQASLLTLENIIAAAILCIACLTWWARPSCWKRYPGPTFIFGVVPFIQLGMAPVNGSLHTFFLLQVLAPRISIYANLNNFFFAQFLLLCLFLGCLRLAKSERDRAKG